jgi:hypothetical protein
MRTNNLFYLKLNVILSAAKDLGEPRDASRTLRRNSRAFGSLPYSPRW